MKKTIASLFLAVALCAALAVPGLAITPEEQRIVTVETGVEDSRVLKSLLMYGSEDPVTLRLETDVQFTDDTPVVLGGSNYGGMFDLAYGEGAIVTVPSRDVTIDLNGHNLNACPGQPAFEVQSGYTLTIVDSSAAKTGSLTSDIEEAVRVEKGGVYIPLEEKAPVDEPTPSAPPAQPSFTDVAADAWYSAPVAWAVERGITSGTSATTFGPNDTCTTAQILTFLWRAYGSQTVLGDIPFSDVKSDDYYYNAALWAAEEKIVSGTALGGGTPCTRSATMVYLWKLAGSPAPSAKAGFTDVPDGSDYAQAVSWAAEKGITSGTSDTTFSPDQTCTRGQIMTFLYKAVGE